MSDAILFDRDKVNRLDDARRPPSAAPRVDAAVGRRRPRSEDSADAVADAFELDGETRDCLASSQDTAGLPRLRPLHPRHHLRPERGRRRRAASRSSASSARTGSSPPTTRRSRCSTSSRPASPARATPARSTARASWRRCSNGCSARTRPPSSGSSSGWRSSTSRRCAATARPTTTSSGWSRCAREVGNLRRALAAHRSALVALTHPELEALGDNDSGERFQSLLQPLRGHAAGGPRRAGGDRRLVRRPDRPRRAPHERDHEGADARPRSSCFPARCSPA